jgi:hypothetical protein
MIIGDGKRHQLIQRHRIGTVVRHQTRRDISQTKAALHNERRNPEVRRNVFDWSPFSDQRGKSLELFPRVHGFAVYVFREADGAR